MFNIYKKLIVPESSTITSPITSPIATPITTPITSPTTTPITSPTTTPITSPIISPIDTTQTMDTFSLCNCCCSSRSNKNLVRDIIQDSSQCYIEELNNAVDYKYEFGHATHYVYNSNTPRMIFAFDTGTPP